MKGQFDILSGEKLSDEDLHEILEEADRDGDGMISFDEFYRFLI